MALLIYNLYLLIIIMNNIFKLIGMQMDDMLFLGNEIFIKRENNKLSKIKLIIKSMEILTLKNILIFNRYKFFKDRNDITLI